MVHFERFNIYVNYNTEDYGPFQFDCEDALPSDDPINDVTVRSFVGKVEAEDGIDNATESTDELIDATLTAASGDYGVNLYLNFPSTATYQDEKHTLCFELTLDSGATHALFGQYVRVGAA